MAGNTSQPVLVVIGAGGIGTAVARRLGSGRQLVLAETNRETLETALARLEDEGYTVHPFAIDVMDFEAVARLAKDASKLGRIESVIHTAGVSPLTSPVEQIYRVNLLGTAHVIEAFGQFLESDSSMLCVSSSAAQYGQQYLTAEDEKYVATAPVDQLLQIPAINLATDEGMKAYSISKKANVLRVQAAAVPYGKRGVRINAILPGLVYTSMGKEVTSGAAGEELLKVVLSTPIGRGTTPAEIAETIAFLTGPTASCITGAELLIDGGLIAQHRYGAP